MIRLGACAGGFVLALAFLFSLSTQSVAAAPAVSQLSIIDGPQATVVGRPLVLTVRLLDGAASPIINAVVVLTIDGDERLRRRTGPDGTASFTFGAHLKVGEHHIAIEFAGDHDHAAASADHTLVVQPAVLSVQTLPLVAGAVFEYRGLEFTTGDDGHGRLVLEEPIGAESTPELMSLATTDGVRAEFAGWRGKAPDLTATFNVFYRIDFDLHDRLGNAIDPASVTQMTVRSSTGQIISLDKPMPIWVHGMRVVSLAGGLEAKDILYGIDEVTIEGSNVVNRGQQRFVPRESQTWELELLFYRTSIRLSDAIFGLPVRASVRIDYPNGRSFRAETDGSGYVELPPLPRGVYTVTPEDVGMTIRRPLAMSRDADVHFAVITYLDIAVAVLTPTVIALGLLLVGRPHLLGAAIRALRRANGELRRKWAR